MIGKKCLKSLLMFGGIMSVLAFGKTALADEVPVIMGDDGKYDISHIVQAQEGSNWVASYCPTATFKVESVDKEGPAASVEKLVLPGAKTMEEGGAKFDDVNKVWTANFLTCLSFGKFEHAGVYAYKLTRVSFHRPKLKSAVEEYMVRVFVVDGDNGPVVKGVTAEESGLKKSRISFTDKVFPVVNFSLKQEVEGKSVDETKRFKYVVKFDKPGLLGKRCAEGVDIKDGTASGATIPYGKEYEFSVRAGQRVSFTCPVGSHVYMYKKCKTDGYVPKRAAYEDFTHKSHVERVGKDDDYNFSLFGDNDASGEVLVADRDGVNMVVTDTATGDIPLTGLFLDEKSGVMMVAIALGSLVALGAGAVVYKKKTSDR